MDGGGRTNRIKHFIIDVWRAHAANRLKPGQVVAVDFDGTLCENAYPGIGKPYKRFIFALYLAWIRDTKLILCTCREGERLNEAIDWCAGKYIWFDLFNANLSDRIAQFGGDCRKISADVYFDDKGAWI